MSHRAIAAIAIVALLVGCASSPPPPRLQTSLEVQDDPITADARAPLAQLEELLSHEGDDSPIARTLRDLLAVETDQRCRTYLRAGKSAYEAGREKLARLLWQAALDCRPRTPQTLEVGKGMKLVTYRLSDLMAPKGGGAIKHFPLPEIRLGGKPGATFLASPETHEHAFVRELFIALDMPDAHTTIVRGGWVLRLLSVEQHATEQKRLGTLVAKQKGRLINAEVKLVSAPWAKIRPAVRSLFHERRPRVVDASTTAMLGGWVMTGPRLTCYPYQACHILVANQRAYIKDYRVMVKEGTILADPVIGTAHDGLGVGTRSVITGEDQILCQINPRLMMMYFSTPSIRMIPRLPPMIVEHPNRLDLQGEFFIKQSPGQTHWIPLGILPDEAGQMSGYGMLVTLKAVEAVKVIGVKEEKDQK